MVRPGLPVHEVRSESNTPAKMSDEIVEGSVNVISTEI